MEKNELLHLRENLAKAAKRFEDSERRDAASLKELAKEIPNHLQDEFDAAKGQSDFDNAIELYTRSSARREQIAFALSRINDKRFGFCITCEDDIEPRRLNGCPWTLRCIECQEFLETGMTRRPREFPLKPSFERPECTGGAA